MYLIGMHLLTAVNCHRCLQLELKGRISEKQMDDLITSYTAMFGSAPPSSSTQLGA